MIRALSLVTVAMLVGCTRNAVLMPNSDKSLNKPAAAFKEDAAKRFPYPAETPRGTTTLPARAEIGYMINVITLVNYSKETWTDLDLWVNRSYVVHLDSLEPGKAKQIYFRMIYDGGGNHLPEDNVLIDTLELKKDGAMYDVSKQIGG